MVRKVETLDTMYEISANYERINQRNLLFARRDWDESVRNLYEDLGTPPRFLQRIDKGDDGYGLVDYALLSAGRYVDGFTDVMSLETDGAFDLYTDWSLAKPGWSAAHPRWADDPRLGAARAALPERYTPADLTQFVKRAARFLGADLVGIADYDERWVYSHLYRGKDDGDGGRWYVSRRSRPHDFPPDEDGNLIPFDMPRAKSVVVLIFEEDLAALNTSPAAVNMAATGLAYSRMAVTSASMAEFLRTLGYWARSTGNDLALSIPFAVAAGLGELGRHGQLITREYGSRVRIAKVFTDLELVADSPKPFGVWEYCKVCKKCADNCPSRAIPFDDEPSWAGSTISSNSGIQKWHTNAEQCSRYIRWNGGDCTNCQSRCPYNKDYSHWYHRLALDLAPKLGKHFATFALWLDDVLGFGKQSSSDEWWASEQK